MAAVRVDAVEGDCTRVGLERTGEAESDDRAEEMTGPFPFSCLNASGSGIFPSRAPEYELKRARMVIIIDRRGGPSLYKLSCYWKP